MNSFIYEYMNEMYMEVIYTTSMICQNFQSLTSIPPKPAIGQPHD